MRRKGSITECFDGEASGERNASRATTTSTTAASSTPPSQENQEVRRRPQKEGFLAFFARTDARQIKKIAYPHDKKNRSGRLQLLDYIYLCAVGLLCLGISGALVGLKQLLASTPNFLTGAKTTIHLPPNNLIPEGLAQRVKRRSLPLPLLLENVLDQPSARRLNSSVGYPAELDNQTSTMEEYEPPQEVYEPEEMDDVVYVEGKYKDYGEMDLRFLTENGESRTIYRERWEREGSARHLDQPRDDDTEQYWAFDDDWLRNPLVSLEDDQIQDIHKCRRNSWARKSFPTGNLLHEIDLVHNVPTLVGEGAYREVFVVERQVLNETELIVLKEIRYDNDMEYDAHYYVRVDSLVTERMTSNRQIVDLYGYTGFSMLAECFVHGDVEEAILGFDDRDHTFNPLRDPELRRWINFTGSEKLQLALAMVQPVAALHNFKDGSILHVDIQLSQFLWTDETHTSVKLNDFNRAEVLFWDEEYTRYCKFCNGKGAGDWRSPEEYRDKPLNDKIDVWSLGNNFYSILSGYMPFFNVEEGEAIRRKIARGETANIDPRFYNSSFAERKLVEVIGRCYVYNPDERADINEIQQMLETAIAENEELKAQGLEWPITDVDDESERDDKSPQQQPTNKEDVIEGEEDEVESHDDAKGEEESSSDDEEGHSDYDEFEAPEEVWSSGDHHSEPEGSEVQAHIPGESASEDE